MFKEYLLSAKNSEIPISLYTNKEDTERFSFGFVQEVSDDWVLLASISPFGFYDGFIIKKYEDIFRCESNDKYGKKIHKLYQLNKQNHSIVDLVTNNLILCLFQYAQNNKLIVSIELFDSECDDMQGFITNIQDDNFTIEQVDEYGNADGKSIVFLEDVTCVTCDSEEERSIKLLSGNP